MEIFSGSRHADWEKRKQIKVWITLSSVCLATSSPIKTVERPSRVGFS